MAWIKLRDLHVNVDLVAAVRPSSLDGGKSTCIWLSGQSALDGNFLVEMPIAEVMEKITTARLAESLSLIEAAEEADGHPVSVVDEPEKNDSATDSYSDSLDDSLS